jgi:bifunctional UDP-N-acetylglucosamine pyrophosphorylase/glucosamine-1-phosphate N-acetyltransferase
MSTITKVVVSAAGQGTRMLELTKDKSKHLIFVEDRPFLAYLLDNIINAGYSKIMLVTGFRDDAIRDFLKNYKPFTNSSELVNGHDYAISVINQHEILGPKEKEYGTACPIKCVKDWVGGEQFISLAGDNFYEVNDLKSMNIDDNYNYVAGFKSERPENFGVLIEEDGFLKEIIEKPKKFVGNLINASLYKFTPEVFDKLSLIKKSLRGEYEITDVISLLAKEKKVKVKKFNGFWMDFGRPNDIDRFSEFLKRKMIEK